MASDECSAEAYWKGKPTRAKKREIVYEAIKSFGLPISDYDVAKRLGWPINCVTPRRLELECAGRVHRLTGHRNETGRRVNIFYTI